MPLRAYIDTEEIISFDQTDQQWNDLKNRLKNGSSLKLPCCKKDGFLKTSSKGLKYFAHSKSDTNCDWKPESPEQLNAKIEIIEACKENGWIAISEFSESDWKADVLAIQNEKRIAFEVQWNKQTFEETMRLQQSYSKSNVRGCWFFKSAPKELRNYYDESLKANKDIPAFKIFKDENSNIIGQLSQTKMPIKELVSSLLTRKLKFCNHIKLKSKQEVEIIFFDINCWKCNKEQHLYSVKHELVTVCSQNFNLMNTLWDCNDLDKKYEIYEAVKQIMHSENGSNYKVGQLKNRYSGTIQDSYLSHGCYYCDALFGDFYLTSVKTEGKYDPKAISHKVEINFGTIKDEEQHWCYSDKGEHCE